MIDKLGKLEIGEVTYPIAFNLNVLEGIQEEYDTIDDWQELLTGADGMPNIKCLKWSFTQFINEGLDIENETAEHKRAFLTEKQVGRLLGQIGWDKATTNLFGLIASSTSTGDEDPNE